MLPPAWTRTLNRRTLVNPYSGGFSRRIAHHFDRESGSTAAISAPVEPVRGTRTARFRAANASSSSAQAGHCCRDCAKIGSAVSAHHPLDGVHRHLRRRRVMAVTHARPLRDGSKNACPWLDLRPCEDHSPNGCRRHGGRQDAASPWPTSVPTTRSRLAGRRPRVEQRAPRQTRVPASQHAADWRWCPRLGATTQIQARPSSSGSPWAST